MPKPKVDQGFNLSYWSLSYRRKFIRSLWLFLFIPLMLLLPEEGVFGIKPVVATVICLVLAALQAGYNYYMWQTKEKGRGPNDDATGSDGGDGHDGDDEPLELIDDDRPA